MSVCWACEGTGDIAVAGMLTGYPRKPCEVCKGTGTSNKPHNTVTSDAPEPNVGRRLIRAVPSMSLTSSAASIEDTPAKGRE